MSHDLPTSNRHSLGERLADWLSSYVSFCFEHGKSIVVSSVALAALCLFICRDLPIRADFADLLPPSAESVKQLHALEARTRVPSTFMIGVESSNPTVREGTARELVNELKQLPPELVAEVKSSADAIQQYYWDNRFLFAEQRELEEAKDALAEQINPLSLDLGDDDEKPAHRLDEIKQKLDEQKRELDAHRGLVSPDGKLQLIIVRTAFSSGEGEQGKLLVSRLSSVLDGVQARVRGRAEVGMTGDILTSLAEQRALVKGMALSTLCTVVLVAVALLWFYRSLLAVLSLLWSLMVGTLATFALTRLSIGHLNLASAFLSSIVIGNGVNFGIILLARYFELRRMGLQGKSVLSNAAAWTSEGTFTAALAAAVAYGSLIITPFRGFRDFGVIAGMGMLLCWCSTFTVLPALLSVCESRLRIRKEPLLGHWLSRLLPQSMRWGFGFAVALLVISGSITTVYLCRNPLEKNMKNLRSETTELADASAWMDKFDKAFGHGISGGFVIAVEQREQAKAVAEQLRRVDEGKPERARSFSRISTLDDWLPPNQKEKLELLGEIRRFIDRLAPHADDHERQLLLELRPPDGLRLLGDADVPSELAWPYTERDGSRGKLILANNGLGVDSWNLDSLRQFAQEVRSFDLPAGVLVGGSSFVFSDMLSAMMHDGPRTTGAAVFLSIVAVVLCLGFGRYSVATILSSWLGTLLMLAIVFLLGLKVNFLDFVALPITLGISVDYSVNLVARERRAPELGMRNAVNGVGGAVALCSYTTVVGYASLLFSQNLGIHSFGLSAMVGELTCLGTSLFLTPLILESLSLRRGVKGEINHG